jgi:hypothetical protein
MRLCGATNSRSRRSSRKLSVSGFSAVLARAAANLKTRRQLNRLPDSRWEVDRG